MSDNKEMSFRSKMYLLISVIAIVIIIILLYRNFETQAILRECEEIENEILRNPELQKLNSTCMCLPGRNYLDTLNDTEELIGKADLKYMIICESMNQTRLYPVWESH